MQKHEKHLRFILDTMCSHVGADYSKIDFKVDGWYKQHRWTEVQQEAFAKWLAEYLYKNVGARKELMEANIKNKGHCKKAADYFMFNYGWSFK